MKKTIDILELINIPIIDSPGLLAFNLDAPETGTQIDADAVEFWGWVLGKESPAIAVEVVAQGRVLKTIPVNVHRPDVLISYPQVPEAGISGFQATLDLSKGVDLQNPLMVYGILRDQSLVKMPDVMVKLGSDSSFDLDNHNLGEALEQLGNFEEAIKEIFSYFHRSKNTLPNQKINMGFESEREYYHLLKKHSPRLLYKNLYQLNLEKINNIAVIIRCFTPSF